VREPNERLVHPKFKPYDRQIRCSGRYGFDHTGVYFIAVVNVANLEATGSASPGTAPLKWLEPDLAGLSPSTPIVVFAHVLLWSASPGSGWDAGDGVHAPSNPEHLGSAPVLDPHIH